MQTCTYLQCHKRQSLEVNFYYIDIYKKERGYLEKTFFLWLSNPEVQDAKDNVVCFFVSFFVYFLETMDLNNILLEFFTHLILEI